LLVSLRYLFTQVACTIGAAGTLQQGHSMQRDFRLKHPQFAFQEQVHLLLPLSCGATPSAFFVAKLSIA
jgi:hypothetical protein